MRINFHFLQLCAHIMRQSILYLFSGSVFTVVCNLAGKWEKKNSDKQTKQIFIKPR